MWDETIHEMNFHDMLSSYVGENVHVTLGYQDYLRIIQDHLQSLYGERANWKKCVEQYFSSAEYQKHCHMVGHYEEIPILTREQIEKMIQEDEEYHRLTEEFLHLTTDIRNKHPSLECDSLFRAAEMIGILPEQKRDGLYRWIISREGLSNTQEQKITENLRQSLTTLFLTEDVLSTLFVPGLQLSFPNVGTAMTQQKGKYYYRGENAYYGSSKPGFFRQRKSETFPGAAMLADYLILNEACFFLEQFDAVKHWGPSAPNYLALAQHYGIKTPMMDLTSNFKTALFFACCKYQNGKWQPLTKEDFERKEARSNVPINGDSRYGIIYRSPAEITDMR